MTGIGVEPGVRGRSYGGRGSSAKSAASGRFRLVRSQPLDEPAREWTGAAAELFGAPGPRAGRRPVQILGGPGSGKTSLLIDLAVDRITRPGADPEAVLVLTQSRRAAAAVREAITTALCDRYTRATREPLVRTVHSYAFAVLRLQASAHGNPPPRLITGAEQDAVLRELLRGEIADGSRRWPQRLRPALGLAGFAAAVRDIMLRSAERGLGPEDLIRLGRRYSRPEWVAAGRLSAEYEQTLLLRGAVGMEAPQATAPALDAAELISAALSAFATDPVLLTRERERIRYLLVDDAQHLDPQAASLIRLIGTNTELTAIAGDGDQSIFGFRGADPTFLADLAAAGSPDRVVLDFAHRGSPAVVDALARISARLPGTSPQRGPLAAESVEAGSVSVRVLSNQAKEAAVIADTLRRAHLSDGVPWSRMAVVVRSVPLALAPLRRAMLAAGVPVTTSASALPLARQHGVNGLLLVLRALSDRIAGEVAFTADHAVALVSSQVGGADPLALRRLRRGLRRAELASGGQCDSAELLRIVMVGDPSGAQTDRLLAGLSEVEAFPLRRVLTVLGKANARLRQGRGVEEVLWAAWQATGLQSRWAAASARGGPIGAQADRDLDAVVALFDAAANHVDRLPAAQISGFVEHLDQQEIPSETRSRAAVVADSVTILSAHAAAGREWDVVAVAGVQEGVWPSLRSQGSLLGTQVLIDVIDGLDTTGAAQSGPSGTGVSLSRCAPLLAEERRLFLVACSRARRVLLVTAVQSTGGETELVPSRFLEGVLAPVAESSRSGADDSDGSEPGEGAGSSVVPEPEADIQRVLALPALVASLRAAVCDPEGGPGRRTTAARHLARLAAAGVVGAHPSQWYGLAESSSATPLWEPEDGAVPLSPSTVELLTSCSLRWLLERHGGTDGDNTRAVTGSLVHTLVQAVAGRIPDDQIRAALVRAWDQVDLGSPWYERHELARAEDTLETFRAWLRGSRTDLTEAGVEVPVDVELAPRQDGDPRVRIRGRIDRLERDPDGRPVIVDVKTGRTATTAEATVKHAQLATYQVAAAHGGIEGEEQGVPGGARLVFVSKPHKRDGATERRQPALTAETLDEWLQVVHEAAARTKGPRFEAQVNDGCSHCSVATSCPAQDSGRQVTGE